LKEGNGIDLVKRMKGQQPNVKLLVASMHDEALYAERALRAGAAGYVSKHESPTKMLDAIRAVLGSGIYLSPQMTAYLMPILGLDGQHHVPDGEVARLSDRELEVFEAIGHGRSTRVIAEQMNLSFKTIESHRENIKRKLLIRDGTELIRR